MSATTPRNIWLIARREYLQNVTTKGFLIGTLLMPVLLSGLIILPAKLATMRSGGEKKIVVVATDAQLGQAVKAQLESKPEALPMESSANVPRRGMTVTVSADMSSENRRALSAQVDEKKLDGFLWVSEDALQKREVDYVTRDATNLMEVRLVGNSLTMAYTKHRLAERGVSADEVDALLRSVRVSPVRVDRGKETATNSRTVFLAAMTLMMMLYFAVLIQGITVMRAVLDEKSSRVMEVLLSACSAKELMMGKLLGVGAVGLTQIALWAGLATVFMLPWMVAAQDLLRSANLGLAAAVFFPLFYILGYLLYSSIYAAVGAMVNTEQEAQSLQFVAMLPLILSTVLMMLVVTQPNSPVSVGLSLFPFTAPLLMYLRIAVQQPPWWQIAASILLLVGAIYAMMALTSRIYRVGVLMYGKRPTLPEIIKWIKYA